MGRVVPAAFQARELGLGNGLKRIYRNGKSFYELVITEVNFFVVPAPASEDWDEF